jgi:taurine dehydrogenase small subunit
MARKITHEYLDEIQAGFNDHDVPAILSHFADDCVWVMASGPEAPEGRVCHGKQEIGEVLSARYAVIPDMRWEEIRHWVVDETKALSEWIVRGTKPDGSVINALGCDLWEFRDGLVTKKDTYWKIIDA